MTTYAPFPAASRIRASFALLEPRCDEFAARFFARLFATAPHLRPRREPVAAERCALLKQLFVNGLQRVTGHGGDLPSAADLGIRRPSGGVTNEHMDWMGAALLWTLGDLLGDDFTPELREAWTEFYVRIANELRDAVVRSAAA